MPRNVWHYKVDLKGVFRNEEMTFEERRDEIVRLLRASPWYNIRGENGMLHYLVDELSEVDTQEYFNQVWNCIYDEADADRAWISTF